MLRKVGVILGEDDSKQLQRRINIDVLNIDLGQASSPVKEEASPKVSLESFCNLTGIPLTRDRRDNIGTRV
jgi:hypothetical protein